MKRLVFSSTCLVAMIGTAAAQPKEADRIHDPLTMDRLTPQSTFGFDVGYVVWDDDNLIDLDITAVGFGVAAHFVGDAGLGGYLTLPLSYIGFESAAGEENEVAIGNIEVGGMYAMPLGRNADLVLHGGVALPTADDDDAGASQALASAPRYGDLVLRWPDSTWLRLGASPMGRAGILFWRADVGLDLALDDDDAVEISPVLRVNVGGGLDLGAAELMVELVTNVTNPADDDADESASTLALGGRFGEGSVQPGLAVILPVGFEDNVLGIEADFAVAFSLAARM